MNSAFKVIIGKKPMKFLNKQEPATKKRILQAIESLKEVPPKGDIKKMKGDAARYRFRVGTYRVIFTINLEEKVYVVVSIGNHGDIYKG